MKLNLLAKNAGRFVAEQSPQILTILGVVGVGATAYLMSKAAVEAHKNNVHEEDMKTVNEEGQLIRPLTWETKVRLNWRLFVVPATTGVMTVGCIVAANRVQARRFAALAAAYGLISGDFDEFRDKAAEKLGLKPTDEVDKEIAEGKVLGNLPHGGVLPDGKTWFCDMSSMRLFPSTMETVKSAMNAINYKVNTQESMSLNEFYELLDLDSTTIGDIVGWNSTHPCEITFTPLLTDTHGAVTAFRFTKNPIPKY